MDDVKILDNEFAQMVHEAQAQREDRKSVAYLVTERQAREMLRKERDNRILWEKIQQQEIQEAQFFRFWLPVAAAVAVILHIIGAYVGWIKPLFAAVLIIPWMIAGLSPLAPWRDRMDRED